MRVPVMCFLLAAGLAAGCGGESSTKPVELLDERTGMTVAALNQPIELDPSVQSAALISRQHQSFAYLGPVEWNRSGTISYGLWVHIAPGSGTQPADIHAAGALSLILADGALDLPLLEVPRLGTEPYREAAGWGQTAYFGVTQSGLRRLAASPTLTLEVRAADGSVMTFSSVQEFRSVLSRYLESRGITGD